MFFKMGQLINRTDNWESDFIQLFYKVFIALKGQKKAFTSDRKLRINLLFLQTM